MTITDDYGRHYDVNTKNITYIERKTHHGSMGTYFNINISLVCSRQLTLSYDDLITRNNVYMILREAIK